ncbi:MAG: hypothetical protein GY757_26970 [bacterium]|nr:hypothetical protein [bacterium]
MKKFVLVVLVVFLGAVNAFGVFSYNKSCDAWDPDCNICRSKVPAIDGMIVDAGGYFLKANSDFQLFLSKVELLERYSIDEKQIQKALKDCIINMELARAAYEEIVDLSADMPYSKKVTDKLKAFDYNGYRQQNNLNDTVFNEVREYLSTGDTRGSYKKFLIDTCKILKALAVIDKSLKTGVSIKACWRTNQQFHTVALFGQYVAEVFYNI